MNAYLDYNIFTAISQGEYNIDRIRGIDRGITHFPYSAAHIQEADNISHTDPQQRNRFIDERLTTIRQVSNNYYIYYELKTNQIHFLKEDPCNVLETIREYPIAQTFMQVFTSFISPEQKKSYRDAMGIDPRLLNNYQPTDVVEHLNQHLIILGNYSFIDVIDTAMSHFPQDGTYGLHNKIAAVYELLDLMGYWKDKESLTSNYARLWDASHTHYASYCDYFISDDKRTRYKAKVVYDLFKIPTRVFPSSG